MWGEIEILSATIDRLLAAEVDGLTDAELDDAVVALSTQRNRLALVSAELLARWQSRGVWSADGSRSAASRLATATHSSQSRATSELRRARQLQSMPVTRQAVAEGAISLDVADVVRRANRPGTEIAFAHGEQALLDAVAPLRFKDAIRAVDYWCQRADPDGSDREAADITSGSQLHASATTGGTVVLNGELEPVGGQAFLAELDRLERAEYLADQHAGDIRSPAQRRAAALVEMAHRSATAPAGGIRPRPLITFHVGNDRANELCELAAGTILTPGQIVPWLGDADLETVLFDGPSTVISVSRRRRFTGALRRAIEVRDRRCGHPSGCDVPERRCDVDHIVPYTQGGPTSQFNGRLECTTHNRDAAKHDHGAQPFAERPITILDHFRARLRWQVLHLYPAEDDDADADTG